MASPLNHEPNPQPHTDSGLACLVLLAKLHEKIADPDHLRHEFAAGKPVLDTPAILLAAKSLGLKAKEITTATWEQLPRTPLPAIAQRKDGTYFVLAKVADDKVLIHDPALGRPTTQTKDEFLAIWSNTLVLLTRRSLLPDSLRRFDITWFIPEIVKYRRLLGEVLLGSFFLQIVALLTPLIFQVVIDKVLVHRSASTLDVLVFAIIVVAIFEAFFGGLRGYILSHTTSRMDVTLGARLFRHLLNLPIAYFQARRVGDTVARVRELETIRNFLTGSALTSVIDLFFTVVFFAVMWYYAPTLTLIVLGSIPVYVLLSVFVTPVLRARIHEKFNRGAENQAFLVESINGLETIKASAVEPQMRRRWEEQLAGYVKASFRAQNLSNIASQLAQLISKITTGLTLWFGAHMVMDGTLSVGGLIAFNMLAGRVTGPILRLAQLWQEFQQVSISIDRLGDVLNTPNEIAHSPNKARMPAIKGSVTFERVSFRYQPDSPTVLNDISLQVNPGEVIGIVGASGSGKSTLTKLIQRLYVPEKGRVLVDGTDIALIDPSWLRRQVGVVLQENFLFNKSVAENITLADPTLNMDQVIAAAKLAGAHEFILELPQGYDTLLGEKGGNLSGGQRQRIDIARALVTNPRLLILDEATSALDYESERIIQDNMKKIAGGRTVFIIAHRLSTVYDANRIIVLEKGRIVEQGSHDELVKTGGVYARLFRMQTPLRAAGAAS